MKELNITNAVINGEEQPAVNARELWKALQSKQEFSKWIKDRLADFEEELDYRFDKIVKTGAAGVTGKQLYHEYTLTLDTAKHLCMLERNEQGKKIRQYFIAVEKEYWQMNDSNSKIPENTHSRPANIIYSTSALIDKINLQLIAGMEVEPEILRYAWNIGRLIGKTMRKPISNDLEEFIMGLASGQFSRNEIYDLYCASCECPVSARRFWPAVRAIRPCDEVRQAYKRYVVFR